MLPQPKATDGRHKRAFLATFHGFLDHDGFSAAGNMAFLTMLSLFPFLIFLIALSGVMGQTERGEEAIIFMLQTLPPEVSKAISGPIEGIVRNTGTSILTTSILFALWTAATGVEAARAVLIKAFGWEYANPIWRRRLESLGIVIVGSALILIGMSVLVLGPAIFRALTEFLPPNLVEPLGPVWNLLNLLISPLVLFVGIYGVYLALTPRRVGAAYRLPGAVLCLAVLIATAKGLSTYLKYADSYDVTYGSLAGVVITQMFCFIVALGFSLGAELNAAYTFTTAAAGDMVDPAHIESAQAVSDAAQDTPASSDSGANPK